MTVSDNFPSAAAKINGFNTPLDQAPPRHASMRVMAALNEQVPMERMLGQLREIIVGPHQRLCEARFEEMIDILAEQKGDSDDRFSSIESDIDDIRLSTSRVEKLFGAFDLRFDELSDKVDDETRAVHEAYEESIGQLRSDFGVRMQMISDTLRECIKELEIDTRRGLLDLSGTFVAHVAEEDRKWERERENSLNTLEQRIAQWRAEVDDDRKQDMDDVAASLVDIGQRMMALRKGPGLKV